jgi:type I restriction enzyme S subunit
VKTGELKDGLVGANAQTEETVTDLALRECSLPLLPIGTLLVAMYGQGQTRGRTGLLACEATTNQACFAIMPSPPVFSSEFLQFWFRANYGRLRSLTENRGGNQPNLNGVLLRALEVSLPTVVEQRRLAIDLAVRIECSTNLIARCRAEVAAIDALPTAVLRAAFNGDA